MKPCDKYISLEGKTALITGAGSGIGLAVAKLYAKYGANVAMVDVNDRCQKEAAAIGSQAKYFRCDVRKEDEAAHTVEAVKESFGKIDILVNNAGINVRKTVLDTTVEEWDLCIDIGLKGTFLFSKYTVPGMIEQGGGIVINTASGAAGAKKAYAGNPHRFPLLCTARAFSLPAQAVPCWTVLLYYAHPQK